MAKGGGTEGVKPTQTVYNDNSIRSHGKAQLLRSQQKGASKFHITGMGKSTNPRFRENEVKKLRSSACSRQEKATFNFLSSYSWNLGFLDLPIPVK